jgi:DNA-binding NarL/FixJ family response regulator
MSQLLPSASSAKPTPITLLLVDDQRLMRDGLHTLLELEDDLMVVAEASNGEEALAHYAEASPAVVLMDIRMPGMDGVETTRRLRARHADARIIILTTFDDDEYVFEGLRAGAVGYLLKAVSGEELAAAIRTVARGGALIDPAVTRKVVAEFARLAAPGRAPALPEPLTEREIEIIQLLARGLNNRAVAQKLFLAEGTVKNYISTILQKLDARDRTHAVTRAHELGLIRH